MNGTRRQFARRKSAQKKFINYSTIDQQIAEAQRYQAWCDAGFAPGAFKRKYLHV